jgi:hypothetical protein
MLYFSSINIKIVILDVAPGTIFVDRKAPWYYIPEELHLNFSFVY